MILILFVCDSIASVHILFIMKKLGLVNFSIQHANVHYKINPKI